MTFRLRRLATFFDLQRGWPTADMEAEMQEECTSITYIDGKEEETVDWPAYHEKHHLEVDAIFNIKWYRVIFDEVHAIKNIESQSKILNNRISQFNALT